MLAMLQTNYLIKPDCRGLILQRYFNKLSTHVSYKGHVGTYIATSTYIVVGDYSCRYLQNIWSPVSIYCHWRQYIPISTIFSKVKGTIISGNIDTICRRRQNMSSTFKSQRPVSSKSVRYADILTPKCSLAQIPFHQLAFDQP